MNTIIAAITSFTIITVIGSIAITITATIALTLTIAGCPGFTNCCSPAFRARKRAHLWRPSNGWAQQLAI